MTTVIDGSKRRTVNDRPALRRVTASPVEEFGVEHWGIAPALSTSRSVTGSGIHTWQAQSFDDLFSLAAADELLSVRGLRTPFLRLAKDGTVLPRLSVHPRQGASARRSPIRSTLTPSPRHTPMVRPWSSRACTAPGRR